MTLKSQGAIKLNAGSSTKVFVSHNGYVGINETSPDAPLHISAPSGNCQIRLQRSNAAANNNDYGRIYFQSTDNVLTGQISVARESAENNGYMYFSTASGGTLTERLRIKSGGELLIGTGGVDRPIAGQGFNSGSGWSGGIQIERPNPAQSNNSGLPWLALTAWNGAAETYTGGISFNRSNSNTQGTQGAVTGNQELGNISFNGSDGTNFINGAEIYAIPDATYSTNSAPTRLEFATCVTGSTEQNPTPRVRINSKGFTGPIPRSGSFQGTYIYRQRNQGASYKHYVRGPNSGYISTELTGDNMLAYIHVQCMGTGTDNAWCYYRYSRDASSGATQVVLDHLSGGSSGNSNVPYMELYNGEASWLMSHSTNYYVVVRVVVIGGTNEITYTTSGEYGSN